jgi:cation transport ATPase
MDWLGLDDVIVIRTGTVVPMRGIITHGVMMIDQHALIGKSKPEEKGIGDQIFAALRIVEPSGWW